MVGFGLVMGFVSWHAAKWGVGFLAWFIAVVAAIAMVNWLQQTFIRWAKEDSSDKNKESINGLVEIFQDAIAGNL